MMSGNEGHHILSLTVKYHSILSIYAYFSKEMLITIIVPLLNDQISRQYN